MTPSEKCVSLETAKRLLAVGFPQDTERLWERCYTKTKKQGESWKLEVEDEWRIVQNRRNWVGAPEVVFEPLYSEVKEIENSAIAAPDAQEIGELLPFRNKRMGTVNDAILLVCKFGSQWSVGYVDEDGAGGPFKFLAFNGFTIRFRNENLAEAMAACYIFLKEQGLI